LAADHAFRCLSGSVAVSAYELEALPLPAPAAMAAVTNLIRGRADRKRIDAACARLYTRPLKNAG
jgi:adenine-specific DNA-methyltransferase